MLTFRTFPVPTFRNLRTELDRAFDAAMRNVGFNGTATYPALTIWSDAERLYAEAELPGLTIKDIEIEVVGDELAIKGTRNPLPGEKLTYHRQERPVGQFYRVVTLPMPVNPDGVEATLKDGVLRIVMPKAEFAKARKITVKSA